MALHLVVQELHSGNASVVPLANEQRQRSDSVALVHPLCSNFAFALNSCRTCSSSRASPAPGD
eukprot:9410205-Heterocapsa_arctica.AAC.1